MSIAEARVFVTVSSIAFVACASALGGLTFVLAPVALAIVFWYSLAKRVTAYTQAFLGLAMAVAPVGGWLAAGGAGSSPVPWLLGLAIGAWVAGFDILYACQDVDFDRREGLYSVPTRFGIPRALAASRVLHVLAVGALAAAGWQAGLGPIYVAGVGVVALLLAFEQSLVRADDLSQVKRAFDMNGWVGVVYFATTAAAVYWR
jgi:4-hydroxybenzoate polyprenyltransferase